VICHRSYHRTAALAGFAWLLLITAAAAQDAAPSVASGALDDTDWYDADSGSLVPIEVDPVLDDSMNRDSRWLPKAKRVSAPSAGAAGGGGAGGAATGGGGLLGSGLTLGNLFGWMLLIAIVAACIGLLLYALSKAEIELGSETRSREKHDATPDEQTIERMKHLPAELRRTDVNLRTEAERLMNEHQYDQAIILLFAHQLLLLDRAGLIRLNRGKTNGKYVRESRSVDRESAAWLRGTVAAFERSYFGRYEIQSDEFAELWQSNLKLEDSIRRRQELAA
jgi:hypothetical protein